MSNKQEFIAITTEVLSEIESNKIGTKSPADLTYREALVLTASTAVQMVAEKDAAA